MFANLAVAFFMVHFTFVGVIFSETKLGKYSPLWHTVKELWPFWKRSFSIWHFWANFGKFCAQVGEFSLLKNAK